MVMTDTLTENAKLTALVQKYVGADTDLSGYAPALVEGALVFFNDFVPNPNFKGFSKNPLFETNLVLDELGADHKHRIERVGSCLLYSESHVDAMGATYVSGQGLECAEGSAQEGEFISAALTCVVSKAAEPLHEVVAQAREAGFPVDAAFKAKILEVLGLA